MVYYLYHKDSLSNLYIVPIGSPLVKKLLVIWHSRTQTAYQAAQAALQGAMQVQDELGQSYSIDLVHVEQVNLSQNNKNKNIELKTKSIYFHRVIVTAYGDS